MSQLLTHFIYQNRYKTARTIVNVPEIRQSLGELLGLIYPQKGCLALVSEEQTATIIEQLKGRFVGYLKSLTTLSSDVSQQADTIVERFFEKLPDIVMLLDQDAEAAFNGDPAAYSLEEVIITYPGFYAVCVYRLAHELHLLNVPLLPRLFAEYAHERTGIDIHPGAKIGAKFFIDHGTGVVIGETTIIGENVKIYQGVTLGALSVKKRLQNIKRHPTIEDSVVIYANSTILGGETVVGANSTIGGNVWLMKSVPAGSIIFNKHQDGDKK